MSYNINTHICVMKTFCVIILIHNEIWSRYSGVARVCCKWISWNTIKLLGKKIQLKFKSKKLWTNKSRLGRGQNNRPNHKKKNCSWIYTYLCNQCLSPLMLWVRISIRARCATLCDKICQWLSTGWCFLPPIKTDHHDIAEIVLKGC
jgi:hypothetical protein